MKEFLFLTSPHKHSAPITFPSALRLRRNSSGGAFWPLMFCSFQSSSQVLRWRPRPQALAPPPTALGAGPSSRPRRLPRPRLGRAPPHLSSSGRVSGSGFLLLPPVLPEKSRPRPLRAHVGAASSPPRRFRRGWAGDPCVAIPGVSRRRSSSRRCRAALWNRGDAASSRSGPRSAEAPRSRRQDPPPSQGPLPVRGDAVRGKRVQRGTVVPRPPHRRRVLLSRGPARLPAWR